MAIQSDQIMSLSEVGPTSFSSKIVNCLVKSHPENATPRCSRSITDISSFQARRSIKHRYKKSEITTDRDASLKCSRKLSKKKVLKKKELKNKFKKQRKSKLINTGDVRNL